MAVAFENDVGTILPLEAVEEAQRVPRGYGFVELAHEDAAILGMDKLANEFADQITSLVAGQSFGRRRDIEDATVGGEDVQKISELFYHALRPIPALGELGQWVGAIRGRRTHAKAGGQWAGANARGGIELAVLTIVLLMIVVEVIGRSERHGIGCGKGRRVGEGSIQRGIEGGIRQIEVHGQHINLIM